MMTRCPICHMRLPSPAMCSRCGSDLRLLVSIHQQLECLLQRAFYHFIYAEKSQLQACMQRARALSNGPLVAMLVDCFAQTQSPIVQHT